MATGLPLDELNDALGALNLLHYFDPHRFGTLDVVRQAEAQLGIPNLAKPHPFSLLHAVHPNCSDRELLDESFQRQARPNVIMVGDSTSDVIMAHAAGCQCVGVLTGVRGEAAQKARSALLEQAGTVALLSDITGLPQWLTKQ
jgi:phosphoglycolate phosphatase-like HAD superfamily hydrolase